MKFIGENKNCKYPTGKRNTRSAVRTCSMHCSDSTFLHNISSLPLTSHSIRIQLSEFSAPRIDLKPNERPWIEQLPRCGSVTEIGKFATANHFAIENRVSIACVVPVAGRVLSPNKWRILAVLRLRRWFPFRNVVRFSFGAIFHRTPFVQMAAHKRSQIDRARHFQWKCFRQKYHHEMNISEQWIQIHFCFVWPPLCGYSHNCTHFVRVGRESQKLSTSVDEIWVSGSVRWECP